jgi:hypothetical protein
MANPMKGEVALDVEGKTYTLRLTVNEIVALEKEWGVGVTQIAAKLSSGGTSLGDWVTLLQHGLRKHHPDLTIEEVGDIITAAGVPAVVAKLGESMTAAFPEMAKGGAGSPPTGPEQVGTGKTS